VKAIGLLLWVLLTGFMEGCQRLDVGSDVIWISLFEGDDLTEWTNTMGGGVIAYPDASDTVVVSSQHAHRGSYAALLTVNAGSDGSQQNAGLTRAGGLPVSAYYSAWYYLPQTVSVGTFWTIFKFRMRSVVDDPNSVGELYDVDLVNLPTGETTLQLFDHRTGAPVPLDLPNQVVPVGVWFQIEAFYQNANDATGRLTCWLDGQQIIDVSNHAMSPTPWVEWDVVSVAANLTPSMVSIFVDDCAVSEARVGPNGIISE